MNVTLLNPPLVSQRGDFLGSGIPYLPHGLVYLATVLQNRHDVTVIDMFGEKPEQVVAAGRYVIQGLTLKELLARVDKRTECFCVYAGSVMAATMLEQTVSALKAASPNVPLIVFENTQAVTGFSLEHALTRLAASGVDYVVTGESETRVPQILDMLGDGQGSLPDGVWQCRGELSEGCAPAGVIEALDDLPFPAWNLLPLENYWRLGYAHGPLSTGCYLAQLTSRGCPFNCRFCVVPSTNKRRWRARSAENVVAEMRHMRQRFGVREFHWEDLNPTTSETRMLSISQCICDSGLDVIWKLVSGTKIEMLRERTIDAMASAGCRYISFSPESGSPRVLSLMGKPFDHEYALALTRHMHRRGIYTQACFVIGFPGETDADLEMTRHYVRRLVRADIDEIAVFIMAPVPGSAVFAEFSGYDDIAQLTFSPAWREDYMRLAQWRTRLYKTFLFDKLIRRSGACVRQSLRFITRRFETKMEMTPYRILRMKQCLWRARSQ